MSAPLEFRSMLAGDARAPRAAAEPALRARPLSRALHARGGRGARRERRRMDGAPWRRDPHDRRLSRAVPRPCRCLGVALERPRPRLSGDHPLCPLSRSATAGSGVSRRSSRRATSAPSHGRRSSASTPVHVLRGYGAEGTDHISVREDPMKAVGMFAQGIAAYDSGKYTRDVMKVKARERRQRRRHGARPDPLRKLAAADGAAARRSGRERALTPAPGRRSTSSTRARSTASSTLRVSRARASAQAGEYRTQRPHGVQSGQVADGRRNHIRRGRDRARKSPGQWRDAAALAAVRMGGAELGGAEVSPGLLAMSNSPSSLSSSFSFGAMPFRSAVS
jgi:hypothetical protein